MNPGDVFNPHRGACGFYPPDIVSALGAFAVLRTRRKFSSTHKALYVMLVRRWGRIGPCFPSQERLASDLGTPGRTIRRALLDLEAFGLIQRRARGRGKGGRGRTDEYSFLWHEIFGWPKPHILTGQTKHFDWPKLPASYKEEAYTSESRTREARQHHQRDDVACSGEEQETLQFAGVRKSAANLRALREFVSAGFPIDQIRGGIALGRIRHMSNPAAPPIVSLRYFAGPITEAGEVCPPGYLEHVVRKLKRELSRCAETQNARPN